MNIAENLNAIKHSIADYEKQFNRPKGSVKLLAASKSQSIEKIRELVLLGQNSFGENYLQEALGKIEKLRTDFPEIEWHFIGPIQSNKTRKIAEHFSWVESVAEKRIAWRLNEQRPAHLPALNICIEVNINNEASKSGVQKKELFALAEYCQQLPRLKLRGIMAIPQIQHEFDAQRSEFHELYELWLSLKKSGFALDTLSMGMSEDYAAAISEGSTEVRIGKMLFGGR